MFILAIPLIDAWQRGAVDFVVGAQKNIAIQKPEPSQPRPDTCPASLLDMGERNHRTSGQELIHAGIYWRGISVVLDRQEENDDQ